MFKSAVIAAVGASSIYAATNSVCFSQKFGGNDLECAEANLCIPVETTSSGCSPITAEMGGIKGYTKINVSADGVKVSLFADNTCAVPVPTDLPCFPGGTLSLPFGECVQCTTLEGVTLTYGKTSFMGANAVIAQNVDVPIIVDPPTTTTTTTTTTENVKPRTASTTEKPAIPTSTVTVAPEPTKIVPVEPSVVYADPKSVEEISAHAAASKNVANVGGKVVPTLVAAAAALVAALLN